MLIGQALYWIEFEFGTGKWIGLRGVGFCRGRASEEGLAWWWFVVVGMSYVIFPEKFFRRVQFLFQEEPGAGKGQGKSTFKLRRHDKFKRGLKKREKHVFFILCVKGVLLMLMLMFS